MTEGITKTACAFHGTVPSVFLCSRCQKPLCQNCRRQKFGSSYCPTCFDSQSFQQPIRAADPVVFRPPSRPKVSEVWLTPGLVKKVVGVGALVWLASNYKDVYAWGMTKLSPYTGQLSKVPGVGTMVDPEGNKNRGLAGAAKAQIASYANGLNTYRSMNGHYPEDFSAFLRENFSSEASQRDMTLDPWNAPFRYTREGNGYELRSAGPDLQWMTEDDIVYGKSE